MSNIRTSTNPNPNKKMHNKSREFKNPSLIMDSKTTFSLTRRTITLTSKTTSQIPDSSIHIPSHLTQPVKHIKSWLWLLPALIYPPFISKKGLKRNPLCYTHNYIKQLTHVLQSRPFSSAHIKNFHRIIQNLFWSLFKLWLTDSLFWNFLAKWTPHYQEGQELDDFIWFVYLFSYDLTQSYPCQFPIDHNVIQLENFNLFVYRYNYDYNWTSPRQFSYEF